MSHAAPRSCDAGRDALLIDHFLPAYQFSERHACAVDAAPERILDAVAAYRAESDPLFRAMIGLRELPMRLLGKASERPTSFGMADFTLLARDETAIVYGLVGQFWRPTYGLSAIADGAAFLAHKAAEDAKLVLAFSIVSDASGRTRLVTETRVHCPSRASRWKFTPYWLLIRPVSGLIRRRTLAAIRRASETGGRP